MAKSLSGPKTLDLAELLHQATTLHQRGQIADAERCYRQILNVRRDHAEARHFLGILRFQQGRGAEALELIGAALRSKPEYAEAYYNRGNILAELGHFADALVDYEQALALDSDYVEAHQNRGNVLLRLGRYADALASYDRVLALYPNQPDAHNNRGAALKGLGRLDEALAAYERAVALRPGYVEAVTNCGYVLLELGRHQEALARYDAVLAQRPDDAEARFAACMTELAAIYRDETEVAASRAAYAQRLEALCSDAEAGRANGLAEGIGSNQPFYLAYQGMNDRDLQARYGELVCRLMAERYPPLELPEPPKAGEPVRVGIVSGFFRQHSNWKIPIKGWITCLDRKRFRLFGYHTGPERDAATDEAAALCERFVRGPLSVEGWRNAITADRPHVLIYPEVGMDPMAARLAAQRLAPVQCNSWGHPDTSGFPTLDYYLSSDLMEPTDADGHYTERLIRLPNLSINYEPLDLAPANVSRDELGLRDDAVVYWCGQSMFKYLPQYDAVFARIAREVPSAQFAFIRYRSGDDVTDIVLERLARVFAAQGLDAKAHVVVLPRLDQSRFLGAVGQADIFLDSLGWSGCNSLLESLAHDLPVVTMPGALMRGRHGSAILTMMGETETIAGSIDDYVAIAARLGRDAAWRDAVKARMAANKHKLYGDRACVAALEDFLGREIWAVAR